jgi:hypothetical protein
MEIPTTWMATGRSPRTISYVSVIVIRNYSFELALRK